MEVGEQEAPPKRGSLIELDDEDDDAPLGGRNNGKPDGNKMAQEKLRKEAENSSLIEQIDHMVNSNELMVAKTFEAKMAFWPRRYLFRSKQGGKHSGKMAYTR